MHLSIKQTYAFFRFVIRKNLYMVIGERCMIFACLLTVQREKQTDLNWKWEVGSWNLVSFCQCSFFLWKKRFGCFYFQSKTFFYYVVLYRKIGINWKSTFSKSECYWGSKVGRWNNSNPLQTFRYAIVVHIAENGMREALNCCCFFLLVFVSFFAFNTLRLQIQI